MAGTGAALRGDHVHMEIKESPQRRLRAEQLVPIKCPWCDFEETVEVPFNIFNYDAVLTGRVTTVSVAVSSMSSRTVSTHACSGP